MNREVETKLIENHARDLYEISAAYNKLATLALKTDASIAFVQIVEWLGKRLINSMRDVA